MKDAPWEDPDRFLQRLRHGKPTAPLTPVQQAQKIYVKSLCLNLSGVAIAIAAVIYVQVVHHGVCQ